MKLLEWTFLFLLLGPAFKLPAQQTGAERNAQFEAIKADAEKGDAEAQYILGSWYATGNGVATNEAEAVKWFREAAENNLPQAQYSLGYSYALGVGVKKNTTEAAKWFYKAAQKGDQNAQFFLGLAYNHGEGVIKNPTEAAKWFNRAAEQGNPLAEYSLGIAYYYGEGVVINYIEAYKWINLASAQGIKPAKNYLSNIQQQMTSEQIAEAQKQSSEFVPKNEAQNSSPNSPASHENPIASGSSFFITDDGYLISNYHVVKGATKVRLLTGAGLIDAKVVQVDAANDLALLKADGRFAPLPILPSRSAHLGGTVATIGFPDPSLQGFSPKLAKGEIASLSGAADDPRYFQISVPVQPGNSGGALVDERGNVIGIVSAKLDASVALAASGALPENVNYAVKSSLLLSFLESVPDVANKLKEPNTKDESFQDVVKSAQDAAVLVLVY